MFLDNQRISFRQVYRLYLFSLVGISTLVIPGKIAEKNGVYGVISILLGGALAFLYLFYLKRVAKNMETDLITYLDGREGGGNLLKRGTLFYLAGSAVMTAGYVAFVFSKLVQKSLTAEENYLLILALIVLVGGYAVVGGIESRARVYEVMFWFVLIPMFLLLLISLKGINFIYFDFHRAPDYGKMLQDGYLCFLPFQTLFFALLLPKYVKKDYNRLFFSIGLALFCGVGILIAFFLILVGTFGAEALSKMEFPAVTFLNNVQFTGGFFKRLDAIMMGIWFFTLFALMNMNIHYGGILLKESVKKRGEKRYLLGILAVVYLLAAGLSYVEPMQEFFFNFFLFFGVPMYVLLPGIFLAMGRKRA